jgi:hypothetical protein
MFAQCRKADTHASSPSVSVKAAEDSNKGDSLPEGGDLSTSQSSPEQYHSNCHGDGSSVHPPAPGGGAEEHEVDADSALVKHTEMVVRPRSMALSFV